MKAIQLDYKSKFVADMNRTLELICADPGAHQQACTILRRYDGVASIGSVETTVFQKLFLQLMQMPLEEVGQGIKQMSQHWANPIFLKRALEGAFDGSNASCTTKMDAAQCRSFAVRATHTVAEQVDLDSPPAWGEDVHLAKFTHVILNGSAARCLGNRQVQHGGDDYTVNVGYVGFKIFPPCARTSSSSATTVR